MSSYVYPEDIGFESQIGTAPTENLHLEKKVQTEAAFELMILAEQLQPDIDDASPTSVDTQASELFDIGFVTGSPPSGSFNLASSLSSEKSVLHDAHQVSHTDHSPKNDRLPGGNSCSGNSQSTHNQSSSDNKLCPDDSLFTDAGIEWCEHRYMAEVASLPPMRKRNIVKYYLEDELE